MARTNEARIALLDQRLEMLGATDEQVDLLHGAWEDADDHGRMVLHATGDMKLLALLQRLEAEEEANPRGPAPNLNVGIEDDALVELVAGKIVYVKQWVGADKDRAQAALEIEERFENPRPTLVRWLQTVADRG